MKIPSIIAVTLISALFLTSIVLQPRADSGSISLSVEQEFGGIEGSVLVNYSIPSSSYSDPVNIVLIPLNSYRSDPIFIFVEQNEFSVEEYASVLGLYDHLSAELINLGMNQTVEIVDYLQVEELLKGGPSVLILTNSSQNWVSQSSAMLSWVERGGVIIGLGNGALPFISSNNVNNLSEAGYTYRIRYESLEYEGGQGVSTSATAAALDLKYASPRYGMVVSDVESYGQAIGYLYLRNTELTSAALIHRGNGSIILMSGIMTQPFTTSMEDVMANDLANMLASGLPWESGDLYLYQVTGGVNSMIGSFIAHLSPSALIACYAFSLNDDQHQYRILII